MTDEELAIRTRVQGAREAAGDLDKVSRAADRVGRETDQAGDKAQRSGRRLSIFGRTAARQRGPLSSLTRSVLGFTGAFAAISGLKASVDVTEDLGKGALGLARNLGLADEEAVRWAGTAKLRGIDTAALGKSGAFLGKQMLAAAGGSKEANAAFRALGVSQETIRKGNFTDVMMEMADGYKKMPAGVRRTAIAQKLMSRGAASLTPLLSSGSKGLSEQLGLMDKYGVTALAAGKGGIVKFLEAQRESKAATLGLQVAIGTTLIPVLTKLLEFIPWLAEQIREGDGAFGILKSTLEDVGGVIETVTGFFERNELAAKILTGAMIGLATAFGIAKIIQTVTKAVAFFNATLLMNPIVMIIVGLVLLGIGLVIAYKKFKVFRDVVDGVFSWVRDNWPLLLAIITGPIGLAVFLIVRHWDSIKAGAGAAVGWIKEKFGSLIGFFTDLPGRLKAAGGGIFSWVVGAAKSVMNLVIDAINDALNLVVDHWPDVPGLPGPPYGRDPIPRLFAGGTITRPGLSWVGERGPELLSLPAGASVWPRSRAALSSPLPVGGAVAAGGGEVVVHTHLHLDGREVAVVTNRHVAAATARR